MVAAEPVIVVVQAVAGPAAAAGSGAAEDVDDSVAAAEVVDLAVQQRGFTAGFRLLGLVLRFSVCLMDME